MLPHLAPCRGCQARPSPRCNADCSGQSKNTAAARSHGKCPARAGAHPCDRPLIEPGYILSTSPLPTKGFSWRNLPSSPAGCPDASTLPIAGRTGAGLPAAGTASEAMLGHASRGAAHTRARWKRLLEHAAPWALGFPGKSWLPALWLECAAISGSPPGRGGPGDHVGPGVQLPSIGKKGRAKPSLGSPAQRSTAARHGNPSLGLPNPLLHSRAATSTGPLQPSNKDTLQAHPASTQGTTAVPGAGEHRAVRSILRHTTCTDGGSGTAPVPRKTWLCPCTILPAQSRRAHWVEAEGKQPHTVPLWEHPAQRGTCTLC